jgi:hypothetical protein
VACWFSEPCGGAALWLARKRQTSGHCRFAQWPLTLCLWALAVAQVNIDVDDEDQRGMALQQGTL